MSTFSSVSKLESMTARFIFPLVAFTVAIEAATELLKNPDFESGSFSGNWYCHGACHFTISHDTVKGHNSVQVTHRTHDWSGLTQTVTVEPGHRYVFSGNIKLINEVQGHMYHRVEMMTKYSDSNGRFHFHVVSILPMAKQSDGWVDIGGDFVQAGDIHGTLELYLQISEKEINYLADNFTLFEMPDDNNWKNKANQRIEAIRKADINIEVENADELSTDDLTIELQQTNSSFGFGASYDSVLIVDPNMKAYRDFFFNAFEWGVPTNYLKWRLMEWSKGHANFDRPVRAVDYLLSQGIHIRGHNMFWGVNGHTPAWIDHMSSSQILQEMHTHVNDMIAHTRGKLEHWDVNNENLHGDYFERHTGDVNITEHMFDWIHQLEPDVKLFLNDYNVVAISQYTAAIKNQAEILRKAGAPIYGIGVQSHIRFTPVDMTSLEYRLNKIAEAGQPIWISELNINSHDVTRRADTLDDLLTLYFSHPSVEGIMLWQFWDGRIKNPNTAIATGDNVTPNEAGQRYIQLVRNKWRTNETIRMSEVHNGVRGFKGVYTMNIKMNDHVLETKTFTLGDAKTITISLSGSAGNIHSSSRIH